MEVMYKIEYHPLVLGDVKNLSKKDGVQIEGSIRQKLTSHPEVFGVPLRFSLKGHRKLRVGDYRVVFTVKAKTVKIVAIKHRSVVYKHLKKRLQ